MNKPLIVTTCSLCSGKDAHCGAWSPSKPRVQCTRPWWHLDAHAACGAFDSSHPLETWPRYSFPWGDWKPCRVLIEQVTPNATSIELLGPQGQHAFDCFLFPQLGTWLFYLPADVEVVWL